MLRELSSRANIKKGRIGHHLPGQLPARRHLWAVRATDGAGSGSTKRRLVVERLWAVRLEKRC